MAFSRVCRVCRIVFASNWGNTKYCSKKCRAVGVKQAYELSRPGTTRVTSSTRGAIGELLVAADLMERGASVFRALSPSCPSDLAILYNGKLFLVESRTATKNRDGTLSWNILDRDGSDIYGVIWRSNVQYYASSSDGEGLIESLGLPTAHRKQSAGRHGAFSS